MKCNSNYPCLQTFEEATTSVDPLGEHLHYAVLTMHVFWPIFLPVIVSSERALFSEVTLALGGKLIHWFLKEIRPKRPPHNGSSLRPPFSLRLPKPFPLDDPPDIPTPKKPNTSLVFLLVSNAS